MQTVILAPMTQAEATEWKRRIGDTSNALRLLLFDGHERSAWIALGHNTWSDCLRSLAEEYGFTERRLWQLHQANQIEQVVTEPGSVGQIPERHLRPLASLEPEARREVYQRSNVTAPNGKITAAHVEATKREYQAAAVAYTPPVEQPESATNRSNGHAKMAVHFSSDSPEHYSPALIVDAAINSMGAIDLDPCSNNKDAPNVPALEHYTIADDGLSRPWFGRIYMNPPYGRAIAEWVTKLKSEYEEGNTSEAIALVPARTDTQWFRLLDCYPCCYVEGRLTFIGNNDPAPFPSAVFYLGENAERFYWAFRELGTIKIELDEHWFAQ